MLDSERALCLEADAQVKHARKWLQSPREVSHRTTAMSLFTRRKSLLTTAADT